MGKAASDIIEVSTLGIVDDPLGIRAGEKAAQRAQNAQVGATNTGIEAQEAALAQIRGDLQPFRQAGTEALPVLQQAINDPSGRVLNNPFFTAMAADQEQRLMASAAARGKLGSGGTGDDLQRNLLLLGNQFAQQDITNLQNLTGTGLNAATQTGVATQTSAGNVGNLMTQQGNAIAAGTIGRANVGAQATRDIMGLAAQGVGAALGAG